MAGILESTVRVLIYMTTWVVKEGIVQSHISMGKCPSMSANGRLGFNGGPVILK
jgi:hypothetical protein